MEEEYFRGVEVGRGLGTRDGKQKDQRPLQEVGGSGLNDLPFPSTAGISGLAPNVKLMAVKIFGDDGTGYDSDAIMGIDYAIRMGAQISSNSWAVRG